MMVKDEFIAKETSKLLLQINAIKLNPKNPFTWASGWKSPIYCDNRISLSYPKIRDNINNFEKEDILSANLKFKSGLIGNFLITDGGTSPWSWETGTGENIHLPHLKENNLRIIGTEGSLEFPNLKLWKYKNKGHNWKDEIEAIQIDSNKIDAYVLQISHIKDVINRDVEPITGALDAELTLKVALSILESSKSEKTMKI